MSIGLVAMVMVMMICGCAASTFKAKSGSGDPEAPRAILMTAKNVAISSIDGKNVFVTARNWWIPIVTKTKASLIPGEHTLVIRYAQTGWSSLGCQLKIDAQPGRTYVIKGKKMPFEGAAGFTAVMRPRAIKVVIWVEDSETGDRVIDETACEPVTS